MRKRRGVSSAVVGLAAGLLLGLLLFQRELQPRGAAEAGPGAALRQAPGPNATEALGRPAGLLFVGVMTARKYLGTRAKAVFESWGAEVPGRVGFYSSADSRPPAECPSLPLTALPGVDDSYPPQKKSFLMLAHMWQRYGERFEWFLRADDDVYVRMDRLERLLRSVDSRSPKYIGQAGRGNSEEFGLLSLEYDENFCMGGPGVIFSRETLRRIVPHIKHCLNNLYTTHEDVELGRCVRKFAGISCTWSYEMQSILYHNSSGDLAFTGRLKSKEVHRAISMHPVKSPPHMYRLHNYMRGLKIQELQQQGIELRRDIGRMEGSGEVEPRSPRRHWDFVSRSEYSLADSNPRRRIHADLREGLDDCTREVMASINACSRQRGRFVEERQALYGYRSRTAAGVDTVLDLLLLYKKYRGRKVTLPVRRHLYLHQHFTGLEMRELEIEDQERLELVVPVRGRLEALSRFLGNFEQVCLRGGDPSRLVLVLYPSPEEEASLRLVRRLQLEHGEGRVLLVRPSTGNFTRARALDAAAALLPPEALMLFVDVDIRFDGAALKRARRNALRSRRVYFPVVFSQYEPGLAHGGLPTRGFWRLFGFGIVALYNADYRAVGGFDLAIQGWGKEDVDLFEKVVRSPLAIFRAPDLGLVHVYHGVSCDRGLDAHQLAMCKGTRADTYASTEQLANVVYRDSRYLEFARAARANTTPAA